MGCIVMSEVDYTDVQGLVRFGYGHMASASYALVRVKNVAAAKAWLRTASITSAEATKPPPAAALNIAFTASGLRALGVSEAAIAGFSHEFRGGMAQESRARQLGDVGNNDPSNWTWGNPGREPHAAVMFFAEPTQFASFVQSSKGGSWSDAFEEMALLGTSDLDGVEPFGFVDGISQPKIDWEQQRDPAGTQLDYSNIVALGEFLLGYRNEYDKFTDRPLLEADSATANLLPAQNAPEKKDLGRNGTYLVMRQLQQDVRTFWQYLYGQAGGNAAEAERFGAALVGRTRSGDPLASIEEKPIPGNDGGSKNQFRFEKDPAGNRCPFGAHIRRANPRTADFPGRPTWLSKLITMLGFGSNGFRDDLISPVRFHRILRRGREYGPELLPENALTSAPPDEPERGLHFICLNANISRQFEFAQNAWLSNTKFAALSEESDPLLGNREPISGSAATDGFTMPKDDGLRCRISGLPQFVTLRGGAYFFLPSLRALRYFANDGSSERT